MTAYQIAQFIVPNDGLGPPNQGAGGGHYVDWAHGRCFLWGVKSIRAYATTFQTQNPYAAVASPFFTGTLGNKQTSIEAFGLTADGYPLASCAATSFLYAPVFKFDPITLANLGQFGVGGNPPLYSGYPLGMVQLVNTPGKALASISVNGVPYTLGQQVNDAHGGIFRTDTLAAAGFYQVISTMTAVPGNSYICGGQSGGSTGTFYCLDEIISASPTAATSITLRKITVQAGAENWTVSQWPTQNPYISMSSILVLHATDVDATWTNIMAKSVGYDTNHDIVIAVVTQYTGGTAEYLVGVNPSGSVVWKTLLPSVPSPDVWPDLTNTRDALGYITLIGNGDSAYVNQYKTSDGSVQIYSLIGGLGGVVRLSTTDDISGGYVGYVGYNSATSGAPTALSGTPSTFNGHAMIQPVLITPSRLTLTDLNVTTFPPTETQRDVWLSWSDDAGASWSNPLIQTLGFSAGTYLVSPQWRRLGLSRNRIHKLQWSGALAEALTGCSVVYEVAET